MFHARFSALSQALKKYKWIHTDNIVHVTTTTMLSYGGE